MTLLENRCAALAVALVALVCLTGCSRPFITKVAGSLAGPVSFSFYLPVSPAQPAELGIVEFLVQEKRGENKWATAWELKGKQSLDTITYGAKYDGLAETAPAKPLSRGTQYRVLVGDISWPTPAGHSTLYFVFDDSGRASANGP